MARFMSLGAALGLIFIAGCGGNDCDKAGDRIVAKFDECGIDTSDGEDGEDVECTDALGESSLCIADCTEAADCAAFDGSDVDASLAYAECAAEC